MWIPVNSADDKLGLTYQTVAVVYSDGKISYITVIFRSSCKSDITWFPFNKQQCELKFGSWTYNGFLLDIQDDVSKMMSAVISVITNQEWKLLEATAKRNEKYCDCCHEPYQDITFTISLQRRSLYYYCSILLPCLLFSSLVLVFTLPTDSTEKLLLSI